MTGATQILRFCACCPAPCRSALPSGDSSQTELSTPSGLAILVLAVAAGQLAPDTETRDRLHRLEPIRHCAAACPYGYDIASLIAAFVADLTACPTEPPSSN